MTTVRQRGGRCGTIPIAFLCLAFPFFAPLFPRASASPEAATLQTEAESILADLAIRYQDVLKPLESGEFDVKENFALERLAALAEELHERMHMSEVAQQYERYMDAANRLRPIAAAQTMDAQYAARELKSMAQRNKMGPLARAWAKVQWLQAEIGGYKRKIREFHLDQKVREQLLQVIFEGLAHDLENAASHLQTEQVEAYVDRHDLDPYPNHTDGWGVINDQDSLAAPADALYALARRTARGGGKKDLLQSKRAASLLEDNLLALPLERALGELPTNELTRAVADLEQEIPEKAWEDTAKLWPKIEAEIHNQNQALGAGLSELLIRLRTFEVLKSNLFKPIRRKHREALFARAFKEIDWGDAELSDFFNAQSDLSVTPEILEKSASLYNDLQGITGGIFNPSDEQALNGKFTTALTWLAFTVIPAGALGASVEGGVLLGARNLAALGFRSGLRATLAGELVNHAALPLRARVLSQLGAMSVGGLLFGHGLMGMESLWVGQAAWDDYGRKLFTAMAAWFGVRGGALLANAYLRNTLLARYAPTSVANRWTERAVLKPKAEIAARTGEYLTEGLSLTGVQYMEAALFREVPPPPSLLRAYVQNLLYCLLLRAGRIMGKSATAGAREAMKPARDMLRWLHEGTPSWRTQPLAYALVPRGHGYVRRPIRSRDLDPFRPTVINMERGAAEGPGNLARHGESEPPPRPRLRLVTKPKPADEIVSEAAARVREGTPLENTFGFLNQPGQTGQRRILTQTFQKIETVRKEIRAREQEIQTQEENSQNPFFESPQYASERVAIMTRLGRYVREFDQAAGQRGSYARFQKALLDPGRESL